MLVKDMAADGRRMARKLRTFYCGHRGHVTAAMSADLSSGVPWCPQVSAGVRRSKMSAVSADFVKKTGDICGHVLECRGSLHTLEVGNIANKTAP